MGTTTGCKSLLTTPEVRVNTREFAETRRCLGTCLKLISWLVSLSSSMRLWQTPWSTHASKYPPYASTKAQQALQHKRLLLCVINSRCNEELWEACEGLHPFVALRPSLPQPYTVHLPSRQDHWGGHHPHSAPSHASIVGLVIGQLCVGYNDPQHWSATRMCHGPLLYFLAHVD